MAGIGFRLEKMLKGGSPFEIFQAHLHSVLIVAGPWIFSIISIFCLFYFKPHIIDQDELLYFRVTITYSFAFSLIVSGFFYLSLSRYLSDKLYDKEQGSLVPAFNSALVILIGIQLTLSILFYIFTDKPFIFKILSIGIYLSISAIWLVLILLTALRDYTTITFGYLAGISLAIITSLIFGYWWDLPGYFLGFFIGQTFVFAVLVVRIYVEFPTERFFDIRFFSFLLKNKQLVATGIFYNIAIWIDKLVFWFSSESNPITPFLRSSSAYEIGSFLAYLTIIPSLSLFLIRIETGFYKCYSYYYAAVVKKGTYPQILKSKEHMKLDLYESIKLIVMNQGIIALLVITFAPEIISILFMPQTVIPILRICTLGSFLHSLILVNLIFILYFDLKREALWISLIFCITNWGLTWISLYLGEIYWGYGYFLSTLITLIFGCFVFDRAMKRLEYMTFSSQPIIS